MHKFIKSIKMLSVILFVFSFMTNSISVYGLETQNSANERILENPPCVLVIFGATGDLTARKLLPAVYNLAKEGNLSENTVIVGAARTHLTNEQFRKLMSEAIDLNSRSKPIDNAFWKTLESKIFYHQADFDQGNAYDSLQKFLLEIDAKHGTQGNRLYYLATQPSIFTTIIDHLHVHGLIYDAKDSGPSDSGPWSRVLIEKPFGTDLESAIKLQEFLSERLDDSQVYRLDHYLGKEGVQNLMVLRFENRLFEPLWNNQHIDNIQITLSEDIGIGTRGSFWEQTGATKDLLQNHLMQLLAIATMEPPMELTADNIHKEKIKVLESIRPFPSSEIDQCVVRGQYGPGILNGHAVLGYRQEQAVSETSRVETYVAAKIFIDNERWNGVPFYIRAGKRLPKQTTQIVVTFKSESGKAANVLYIRIQPKMGVFLKILAKVPGLFNKSLGEVISGYTLDASFGVSSPDAYEKLIYDSMQGDSSQFVEAEEQFAAWRLLEPVLQHWRNDVGNEAFPNYNAGSWGPEAATRMLSENGHKWELLEN